MRYLRMGEYSMSLVYGSYNCIEKVETEVIYDPSKCSKVTLRISDLQDSCGVCIEANYNSMEVRQLIEALEKCERMRKSWEE